MASVDITGISERPARFEQRSASIAAIVVLALPLALYIGHVPKAIKYIYPISVFCTGLWLYRRQSPWYLGLCVWCFCCTPLIRRLVDFEIGFDQSNFVLLSPYFAVLASSLGFLAYANRPRAPFLPPFAALVLLVAYGVALSVLHERVISGVADGMKWSAGPLLAVSLIERRQMVGEHIRIFFISLMIAAVAISMYGILQFVSPSAWDVQWMKDTAMSSIGQPEPFAVRVFSTMNSPGSLAAFLSAATLVFLASSSWVCLPGTLITVAGLALTQYRSLWAGTVIGVGYIFVAGKGTPRLRIAILIVALGCSTGLLDLVPQAHDVLAKRVQTFTQLKSDESGTERLQQYSQFLSGSASLIVGEGLAISGASRALDQKSVQVIDGGLIEILTVFGLPLGLAFLGCLISISVSALRADRLPRSRTTLVMKGIVLGALFQLPFGTMNSGENGILFWICVALLLSMRINTTVPAQ